MLSGCLNLVTPTQLGEVNDPLKEQTITRETNRSHILEFLYQLNDFIQGCHTLLICYQTLEEHAIHC